MTNPQVDYVQRRRIIAFIVATIFAAGLHGLIWKHEAKIVRDEAGVRSRDYGAIRLADEQNYYLHGADRVASEGLSYLSTEDSLRSPPLPWLWLLLFSRSVVATRIANIGLTIFGAWLVAAVARDRFGRRTQLPTFLIAACGYQVVLFSATVLTEPLAYFFVCLTLWCVHRADIRRSFGYLVATGVAMALAAFARPSLQLWPVTALGFFIATRWLFGRSRFLKSDEATPDSSTVGFKQIVIVLAIQVSLLAPWLGKNLYAFGVPRIANGFGAVLFLGAELRTDGDEPIFSGMDWPNHPVQGPGGHMSLDGEKRLKDAAMERIAAHPAAWLRLAVAKIGRTLIGGPKWHFYPAANMRDKARIDGRSETVVVYLWWTVGGTLVTVAGLGGLALRFRRGGIVFIFAMSLIAYVVAVHAVTFALPRFAVPLSPAFALGVAAWIGHPPRRIVAALHVFITVGIVIFLTLAYWRRPSCEVSIDRHVYFDVFATQTLDGRLDNSLIVELGGDRPAFNTCIFVTATLESSTGRARFNGHLILKPEGAEFDESTEIGFPMRADGRPHTYMLCTELNRDWRNRWWDAIRFEIDRAEDLKVSHVEIVVGH